jgi:hypothetical protein
LVCNHPDLYIKEEIKTPLNFTSKYDENSLLDNNINVIFNFLIYYINININIKKKRYYFFIIFKKKKKKNLKEINNIYK